MSSRIISEVEIPALAEAMRARGYTLIVAGAARGEAMPAAAILRRWSPGAELRRTGIPEIAVAACRSTIAAALDAGAADAVAAPVDAIELAARVDARVRHHRPGTIDIGDLRIDPVRRAVTRAGIAIELRAREYTLLLHLAERCGTCVSRRDLLAAIWRLRIDPGTNVVAVHVSKLRARIDAGFDRPLLHTVKGVGYRLDPR